MNIRYIYTIIVFVVVIFSSFGQERTVSGVVKDENQQPIPGATIMVKNSTRGTSSDFDGNYFVKVEVGEVLVFSFVGLKTKEHRITATTSKLDIVLENDIQQIEETVVVGYGSGKKITAISGAVSQVKMSDYANAPSANAFDALQGKVAGLQILSSSGEPGQESSIVLHGQGNIQGFFETAGVGTSPLFVLDGTPVSSSVALSMNPSDYESITVLKDASATSIYGARAANGVIYITAKKGKRNEKGTITINTQMGFSNLYSRKIYDSFMNSQEYMDYWVERGNLTRDTADELLKTLPNTRWDDFFFKKNTLTSQTTVSLSGGTEKINYYISGGHFNQEGIMYRSGYERFTLNGNIDANINDWLTVGLNFSTGHSESSTAYSNGAGEPPLLTPPIYSFDKDGKQQNYVEYIWKQPSRLGLLDRSARLYNQKFLTDNVPNLNQSQEILPIGYIAIEPIKNLIFKTQAGLQYSISEREDKVLPSLGKIDPRFDASTSRSMGKNISKTLTNTLEYKFDLAQKHHFTMLLGQESISDDTNGFTATAKGQVYDELTMLIHGVNNKEVSDYKTISTFNSYFSRLDYNFKNKYFIDFSVRRDGSSNFGKNNKYANFWALGLLWRAKDELFLQKADWLDMLNIRFSIGTNGNAGVSQYSHLTMIEGGVQYNGSLGYTISRIGNPYLKWENQRKTNLGIDVGLFKSVSLEMNLYDRVTSNMLFTEPIPSYTGFEVYEKNVAKLQNRGIDVTFSFTAYSDIERKISIRPYLNFNYNTQKVLEVYEGASRNPINRNIMIKEGEPISFAYPIFKGVNTDTGEPQWYEAGENKTITQTDDNQLTTIYNPEKLTQNLGKEVQAPLNGGFGLSASYQDFTMQVGFSFSNGKYMKNLDKIITATPTQYGRRNLSKNAVNYWRNPGDQAEFPSLLHTPIMEDSRILEDASFIRLKDISLSYTMPKKLVSQIGFFEGIRFFAMGRNLLTFTKYTGADPEFSISAAIGGYPSSKQYTFGLELKF